MTDDDDDLAYDEAADRPSKSQLKRDMAELRGLGERLLDLPADALAEIDDPRIIDAIDACRRIKRGSARKRQLQYIAKILTTVDLTPIRARLALLDSASKEHIQAFHRLERWRDLLINDFATGMAEVTEAHPDAPRQQLRQLAAAARKEQAEGSGRTRYRRLFDLLKTL